jgi:hypothetical protein
MVKIEDQPEKKSQVSVFARAIVACVLIITVGTLLGLYILVGSSVVKNLGRERIETSFAGYVTGLQGSNSLQVARLNTQEEFFLSSEKRLLSYLPGGTVEVAARVPCEITYQVPLKNSHWQFYLGDRGKRLYVIAPSIGFNTPAVDLSRYELEVVKYSFIRDEEEVKQLLQAQIPQKLNEVARISIDSVRDTARLEIKDFVDNWLLAKFADKNLDLPVVDRVFFADEAHLYQKYVFEGNLASATKGMGF